MPFYIRKDKLTTFDGSTAVDESWRERAKGAFCLREGESSISVYETDTDDECDLVAAALTLKKCEPKPVDFVRISREELAAFGEIDADGAGDTPIAAVNARHVSLHTTQEKLTALAEELRRKGRKADRRKWKDHVLPKILATDPATLIGPDAPAAIEWIKDLQAARTR